MLKKLLKEADWQRKVAMRTYFVKWRESKRRLA
jgi:hypothetical protein